MRRLISLLAALLLLLGSAIAQNNPQYLDVFIAKVKSGKRADFVLLDAPSYLHLVYHFGVNLVREVWRDGRRVSFS